MAVKTAMHAAARVGRASVFLGCLSVIGRNSLRVCFANMVALNTTDLSSITSVDDAGLPTYKKQLPMRKCPQCMEPQSATAVTCEFCTKDKPGHVHAHNFPASGGHFIVLAAGGKVEDYIGGSQANQGSFYGFIGPFHIMLNATRQYGPKP